MLHEKIKRNTFFGRGLGLSVTSACFLMASCSSDNSASSFDDAGLLSQVSAAGITGDPTTGRNLPSVSDAKVQLGKKLFFTKGLGGDSDSACVTCHHPSLGGGDNLSLSIGVGAEIPDLLGPGRYHDSTAPHHIGGPTVPRNAPTTFNLAMWDQALFHDGRVESLGKTAGKNGDDGKGIRTPDSDFGVADPDAGNTLAAAQSRFPITSPEEMRGFSFAAGKTNAELRTELELKMTAFGGWDAEFTSVYGDAVITHTRIADAIGEYERSQVFVESPWKAYVEGDMSAIDDSAKRGAKLFFSSIDNGGANCSSCHAGDFFTDEHYHVLASPQIGRGKGNDNGVTTNDDFGRFRETMRTEDMYRFRTPSLLNVEVTGPWGHAGGYTELENMVRHMLNPTKAMADYDLTQLEATVQAADVLTNTQFALDKLEANRIANVPGVHRDVEFSEADVTDLVAFLKSLTDPCVKDRDCLADWVPASTDSDPDSLRLNAVDSVGNPL